MKKKVTINNEIRDFVEEAIEQFLDGYNGTYFYKLGYSDFHDGDWALVIGWSNNGAEDEGYNIADGDGWEVCMKLAYNDSYMQTDFDMDWEMPYNEETGDVDDTQLSLSRNLDEALKDVEWILKRWNEDYAE